MATIDGFRHNLVGANNHSMVFDGCVSCQRSGAKSCERCRKSLQLRGKVRFNPILIRFNPI